MPIFGIICEGREGFSPSPGLSLTQVLYPKSSLTQILSTSSSVLTPVLLRIDQQQEGFIAGAGGPKMKTMRTEDGPRRMEHNDKHRTKIQSKMGQIVLLLSGSHFFEAFSVI
jgi:hypothetical protein